MSIAQLPNDNYVGVSQDNSVHYFEIAGRSNSSSGSAVKEQFDNWQESPIDLGNYKIIPNGPNNDIPKQIQETTLPNSIAPRIQNRKVELLIDQFPYLYETKEGKRIPVDNESILDWLESFDYIELLISNAVDYYYSNIVFNKVYRELGYRLSKTSNSIAKLENISSYNARLAYLKTDLRKVPTHVIVGDWHNGNSSDAKEFKVYPIFNPLEPTKYPISVYISSFKTYGMQHYPLPEIYGALSWIERNSAIPKILKSLTDNSLNIKWHITSPQSFWDEKRKKMMQKCKDEKKEFKESDFDTFRQSVLKTLTDLLSGVDNVGKFWHNETVIKTVGATGQKDGWEIKPIEQKIKDYVKAQLEVAISSAKFVLSSLGLHSALANVGPDGKSDSGSEQIYAYKIHQLTSTQLPEYYVTKSINDIIRIKFGIKVKVGFKRAKIDTESDTTESRRLKNQEEE